MESFSQNSYENTESRVSSMYSIEFSSHTVVHQHSHTYIQNKHLSKDV